ncbi:hypothetical protein RI129_003398 [Pyrocoelia pectoralis]|uniref:Right handed beta helix domain-containing protein n=1 Tax=Pyrocoelia pectoralis TaxID=417401 RepID=A0AAN7VP24_9COLE
MNPVITYNKTYEERLQEFRNILINSSQEHIPSSYVHKIWSDYVELSIDFSGWFAIWKIPRLTCEQFKIDFPVTVFVCVEQVNYQKLAATVKVLADDSDINLTSKHFIVSLIELWPTKKQDKSCDIDVSSTANCLDILRVFYLYIFMPWDLDEDDSVNWVNEHLETRLRLFYDMRTSKFPRHTAVHLKKLLTEARHLHIRQKQCTGDGSNRDVINNCVRMMQIRNEVEFLENPLLRNALLRSREHLSLTRKSNEPSHVVVLQQGKVDDYISFLNNVKLHVGQICVQYKPSLDIALANAITDDIIILSNYKHSFGELCALQDGGVLKGLYSKEDTIICSSKEDNMLDCCGNITFENLTIQVEAAQCGLCLRRGIVTLKNCKLINSVKSHMCDGIIVSSGAIMNIIDCDISGFDRAIVATSVSQVHMTNTKIENVNYGLTIYDNSTVKLNSCQFKNCTEFAIGVETYSDLEDCSHGSFDMLKMFPFITINNVTGENNRADCNINCIGNIDLIQDLLNSQSDDDTHEDTMDTTVVHLK